MPAARGCAITPADRTLARMNFLRLALLAVILWAQPALSAPTIFLVRHAEKVTTGDTKDPDLSEAGRARAESLATMLKDAGITAIYATEFKRTQQTAEPFARATGIKTTIMPAKETESLIAKLKAAPGNSLVVAHSNTLPEILKALGVTDPPQIDEADYDNLFILGCGSTAGLLRLHFR